MSQCQKHSEVNVLELRHIHPCWNTSALIWKPGPHTKHGCLYHYATGTVNQVWANSSVSRSPTAMADSFLLGNKKIYNLQTHYLSSLLAFFLLVYKQNCTPCVCPNSSLEFLSHRKSLCIYQHMQLSYWYFTPNNNNNKCISRALFHVKHAHCTEQVQIQK